jgi:hypothetical protein
MDSSIHHDPFRPDSLKETDSMPTFPADRYKRAGASKDQIADLEADFDALPIAGQQALVDRVASVSDAQLSESLKPASGAKASTKPVAPAEPESEVPAVADDAEDNVKKV